MHFVHLLRSVSDFIVFWNDALRMLDSERLRMELAAAVRPWGHWMKDEPLVPKLDVDTRKLMVMLEPPMDPAVLPKWVDAKCSLFYFTSVRANVMPGIVRLVCEAHESSQIINTYEILGIEELFTKREQEIISIWEEARER